MAEEKKARSFEHGGTKYLLLRPSVKQQQQANKIRSQTFNEALANGDLLRDQLDAALRKKGEWNNDREQEYQTLREEIIEYERTLLKGGIKLTQAKDIALDMADKRERMVEMLSSRTELDNNTCEGQADAARFNALFAECLVYEETRDKYFPGGVDEYLSASNDPVSVIGATEFYYFLSGSENLDDSLPETKFLKKFKFVDGKNRLIDDGGKLVNRDGKHISEDGKFIKWTGDGEGDFVYVDSKGRPVTEEGEYDLEESPFLDDDGKPIVLESEKQPDKPKRKTRKKAPEEEPAAAE